MAIIKCPECGHQTSDKAPVCPSCGVEIAGKITKCPYCGEIYFKNEVVCPHCHKASGNNVVSTSQDTSTQQNNNNTINNTIPNKETAVSKNTLTKTEITNDSENDNNNKKSNKATLIVSVIIALVVLGTCLYFYKNAKNDREQEEYEFAMRSDDPTVLQTYLNNFKDAPQEHLDSITAHLNRIYKQDEEWTNALVSGSKVALTDYLANHPDSPHKQEALEKIDSIDWAQAVKLNTNDAYKMYVTEHSDGAHYEEAMIALKKIKSGEVSADERLNISSIFHNFFVCINSKDESNLTANISDYINFLGKQNATRSDIVSFMHKLYKEDVENMVWSIPGSYDIKKKEIGDEQYEYNTTFMAEQKVKKTDGEEIINVYRINAKVDPDGKITEMSMTKIVQ